MKQRSWTTDRVRQLIVRGVVLVLVAVALVVGTMLGNGKAKAQVDGVVKKAQIVLSMPFWTVYKNKTFGYEIRLPQEFSVEESFTDADGMGANFKSTDGSVNLSFQVSRMYATDFKSKMKNIFGETNDYTVQTRGDEASLLRINDDIASSSRVDAGYYRYRNPLYYQLLQGNLKAEHVDLFKAIVSTLKTTQAPSKFEISVDDKRPEFERFDLGASEEVITRNWQRFKNTTYSMTLAYPTPWAARDISDKTEVPTFEVSRPTEYDRSEEFDDQAWLRIGDFKQLSTAGGVCFNQVCDDVGILRMRIEGIDYETPIVRASVNKYGDPKQNTLSYYAFQFTLDKAYPMERYSEPYKLAITGYFYTMAEGQELANIMATLEW